MNDKDKVFKLKESKGRIIRSKDGKTKYKIEVLKGQDITVKPGDENKEVSKEIKFKIVEIKENSKDEKTPLKDAPEKSNKVVYKVGHWFHHFRVSRIGDYEVEGTILPVEGMWKCTTWAMWVELFFMLVGLIIAIWGIIWGFGKKEEKKGEDSYK